MSKYEQRKKLRAEADGAISLNQAQQFLEISKTRRNSLTDK